MAVTRIKNNQITDSTVNAAAKLVDYSVSSAKLANNLVYSSDLTVTGNLTVQGNTTTIDTTYTVIEDPVILLASNQVGAPSVDIGFIGQRGSANNIAFVWDESSTEFVTAFTTTGETNTTITITDYANLHTNNANVGGNLAIGGNLSITGNIEGSITFTGNLSAGNLLTNGQVSAAGNVTGGNVLTVGIVSATSDITSAANINGGNVVSTALVSGTTLSASGNVVGGNLTTAGQVVATGNVSGGNLTTAGQVDATGNVSGGNVTTAGQVSSTGNVVGGNLTTAGQVVATGNVNGGNVVSAALVSGTSMSASGNIDGGNLNTGGQVVATANITGGNILTGGLISATGNITSAANISGGNISTAGTFEAASLSASGNVTGGNLVSNGVVTSTGNIVTTANVSGGNVISSALVEGVTLSASGNVIGGNVTTAGLVSATGTITSAANITGGNILTGGLVSATGNVNGGNVISSALVEGVTLSASGNVVGGNVTTGGLVSATGNVTGGNLISNGIVTSTGNIITTANIAGGNLIVTDALHTGTLSTTGNAVIAGNLFVLGNITYNNVDDLRIQDPVIILGTGPNGAPLTSPDSYDRGVFMEYYTSGLGNAWMGWQNSSGNLIAAANVSFSGNDIIGVNSYGTFQAGNIYSQTALVDGNITGGNLLTSGLISATGNINGGNLSVVSNVSGTGAVFTGNVTAVNFIGNISGNIDAGGANTQIQFNDNEILNGSAAFTFDNTSNLVTITGNVSAGNVTTGGLVSATGNVVGGNVTTGGLISATGNITGANAILSATTASTSRTTGALTVAGGVGVAGDLYAGNSVVVDGGSYGNVTTTAFASVWGSGGGPNPYSVMQVRSSDGASGLGMQAFTGTGTLYGNTAIQFGLATIRDKDVPSNLVIKAYIDSTGLNVTGIANISGNITGGNITTGGLISATGNITGGNIATAGSFEAASLSATGNIDGGNLNTAGQVVATGNVSGGNVVSSALVSGVTVTASGNVNGGNVISTALVQGATLSASGNVIGGNLTTGGQVVATGNVNGGNVIATTTLTGPSVVGTTSVTGGNIVISGDNITDTNGRVNFNTAGDDVDFAVNGDTVANIFYIDAGTGTASFGNATQTTNAVVAFNATNSILFPVGNTAQRPGTGVVGMLRFNSISDTLEQYTTTGWESVGTPAFTVIGDEQFNGDGSTTDFALATVNTTNGVIVSINGVLQIPTSAYSVSTVGSVSTLEFTEAPLSGDLIDVRALTTTTTVTGISNQSANAAVDTSPSTAVVNITGDLLPVSNVTANLGSATNYWKSLFVGGNTIYLGNLQIKAESGTIAFYEADGTTPAPVSASSVDTSQISSGTSSVAVTSVNGNIRTNVAGTTIQSITTTGVAITGDLSVTGNATLSGNILGDRVQNGTTSIDIQTQDGNANITVSGTSNVAVFASTGAYITGVASATGNITGGNLSVSTGTVTLGGIVNANGNGVGNIGSASGYFNTAFVKATSAQYADLAENYVADAEYEPGTVLSFGGEHEVTLASVANDPRIAGVVSTNPSYIMNGTLEGEYVSTIALTGRVPTKVTGTVAKGDMMIAAGDGRAQACATPTMGTVIGKALENHAGGKGVIEVVIGRM